MKDKKKIDEFKYGKNILSVYKVREHYEIFENDLFYCAVDNEKELKEELDFYRMADEILTKMERTKKK